MRVYEELLAERIKELRSHLELISELNDAAVARIGIANLVRVEIEHVEILKSGFLVHLYNVVEAVMDVILYEVAKATVQYPPGQWSVPVRREWVRSRAGIERDLDSGKRLSRTSEILKEAIDNTVAVDFRITSHGNWSNDEVTKVSDRMGCTLRIAPDVLDHACNVPFQDNFAPMKFVRHKRNRLAHGIETFGSGAILLTPSDLERLYKPVVGYMTSVASSYTTYLDNEKFLKENVAA